jgi:hypothetical protein
MVPQKPYNAFPLQTKKGFARDVSTVVRAQISPGPLSKKQGWQCSAILIYCLKDSSIVRKEQN